jgi:hypothetical protein
MVTQEKLKEVLDYNKDTGIFIWKKKIKSVNKGDIAGSFKQTGYISIAVNGKSYYAHRLAWVYINGNVLNVEDKLDHINRIRTDNSIDNLRIASISENACNTGVLVRNTSGIKGLSYRTRSNTFEGSLVKEGKLYSKSYSVSKYGYEKAKELAIVFINEQRSLQHKQFAYGG